MTSSSLSQSPTTTPTQGNKRAKSTPKTVTKKQKLSESDTKTTLEKVPPINTSLPDPLILSQKPAGCIRIASLNIAGLSASLKKGLATYVDAEDADILCLQETKLNFDPTKDKQSQLTEFASKYPFQYWNHCTAKKGYAGTALLSKIKPISVEYTIGDSEFDNEGRYIVAEFENWYLMASYVPNASSELSRLPAKRRHYERLINFTKKLQEKKPVIWAGDINVAHKEVDLARPKTNTKTAGFTPEEREDFSNFLEQLDMVDSYRELHPTTFNRYTYYSYRFNCRSKNLGWRLDYVVVSRDLLSQVKESDIRSEVYGFSDHVPIYIDLASKD